MHIQFHLTRLVQAKHSQRQERATPQIARLQRLNEIAMIKLCQKDFSAMFINLFFTWIHLFGSIWPSIPMSRTVLSMTLQQGTCRAPEWLLAACCNECSWLCRRATLMKRKAQSLVNQRCSSYDLYGYFMKQCRFVKNCKMSQWSAHVSICAYQVMHTNCAHRCIFDIFVSWSWCNINIY